jgi:DNA adenine methylase
MDTLIKWPGGKTREFSHIKNLIPPFERYIEPFFGGGAVFFQLEPRKAIINDICEELMDFYRFIKNEYNREEFKKELYEYVENWEKIPKYLSLFKTKLFDLYEQYKLNKIELNELKKIISETLKNDEERFNGLFLKKFCLDEKNLLNQVIANLISKIRRTKEIEKQRGKLPEGDLIKNIETAFRSGFYMHFRDVMNFNGHKYKISLAKKIANYYFIREFCYGSMFRFNKDAHFNIPYGGIAYNQKKLRGKVDYVLSEKVKNLFQNTVIENQDFERIFKDFKYSKKDFMFLDPPYDTDFSDYEKKTFDKKDQIRLSHCLFNTNANFILIIKNTPFIFDLYKNRKGIKIDKFEKTYLYNVKGRNNRDVEHLVIYNF